MRVSEGGFVLHGMAWHWHGAADGEIGVWS